MLIPRTGGALAHPRLGVPWLQPYSAISARQGIAVATVRKHMLKAAQACFDALRDQAVPGMTAATRIPPLSITPA